MFYSVIVPSFNREDELRLLLPSLEKLDFSKSGFELIIVDDGSTDTTVNFIHSFSQNSALNIRLLQQQNQGPGTARNFGMQEAKGDIFIFLDSDVTVPENWLTEVDKIMSSGNYDAFGGPDSHRDDFPDLLKAISYAMTSFIGTGGMRGSKGKKLAKYYPRSFNMGVSRKVWESIGGMGKLRHGQDIEFSRRIIRNGFKTVLIENAIVFHKRRTDFKKFFKQVFNWGVARINLWKIDPEMLEPLHLIPAFAVGIYLLCAGLAIPFNFFRIVFVLFSFMGLLVLTFGFFQSTRKFKSVKIGLLSIIALIIQISGYGLGMLKALFQIKILKQKEARGFVKKYYK